MDPNAHFKPMVATPAARHKMASAFLVWYNDDDLEPLYQILPEHGITVSIDYPFLTCQPETGDVFWLAMLKNVADASELTNVINVAHNRSLLPLLIVQYSNDPTDTRGDNVFDIYSSTGELAISHANRVYTRRQ